MKLDIVHDIQISYRKLIDSLSRPGLIADLAEEAEKLDAGTGCLPATRILAQMLLDTEVSFKVVSPQEAEVTHFFGQLTYAKEADITHADYIFVLGDAAPGDLLRALQTAKIGELQNPHCSATLIIEAASLAEGSGWRLTGPGIRTEAHISMRLEEGWDIVRAERNAEFPLGLDLIFVDRRHRLLALPRTAQTSKKED